MRPRPEVIGLLLAAGLASGACAAPGPAMHCRHPLTAIGSADGLPPSITAQVRPWMALHGERWNNTDAISPGERTAGFLWAAHSNANWIVAFRSGGIACCNNRFGLFLPTTPGGASYRQVLPAAGSPDLFGDTSCTGVDAALDTYAARR
jgi:hypothetical protein